jgi:ribonuclease VapC
VAIAESPASVLDASAVLALLNNEEGSEVVTDAIADGAAISMVNLAEVLSKVAERGGDPATAAAALRKAEGSKRALTLEPLTAADCVALAQLRPITKQRGLSLADRACLALSERLGVPALTTDEAWEDVPGLNVEVQLIR